MYASSGRIKADHLGAPNNTAFSSARAQLETLNATVDGSAGTINVAALEAVQTEFEILGLTLRADEHAQFIEAGWSLEPSRFPASLQDSMQFYIIDVASEIPTLPGF